jgi:hypothetical protein
VGIKPSVKLQVVNVLITFIFQSLVLRILSVVASIRIRCMMWGRRIVRAVLARSFCRIGRVLVAKSTANIKLYLGETEKAVLNQCIRRRERSQVLAACLIELTGMRRT